MGYYLGDFYAGARGDPGIGSFFKGLGSLAAGFIPGVGPLASKAVSAIPTGGRAATAGRAIISAGRGAIMRHPVLSAAGAAGIGGAVVGAEGRHILGGHRKCKHVNPRTGKCRRRMNVTNPRALRKAIRRTHGFAKLAMRTIHLVHPKKKVRFGGFKKRKSHK
jgi:hypothetical protein